LGAPIVGRKGLPAKAINGMPMYVLDTDHLSILAWEGPETDRLRTRLAQVDPSKIATTIISFEEQTRGWMAHLARGR
jgi:tRNA(fMet)-specific endonuclease VapC